MTFDELVDKIRSGERFSFSRFGDGEWNALSLDKIGKSNCDGHGYFPDMGKRLKHILDTPKDGNYYLALQSMAYRQRKEQIDEYDIDWCEGNIIHRANIKGYFQPLFDVLNERDVLIVGPEHLKKLTPKYLKSPYFVTIPSKNCWLSYEVTLKEINTLIGLKSWTVLFCASMMTNVLIDDFHGQATLIDVGSAFDPYCNVNSRTYHKTMNV